MGHKLKLPVNQIDAHLVTPKMMMMMMQKMMKMVSMLTLPVLHRLSIEPVDATPNAYRASSYQMKSRLMTHGMAYVRYKAHS